MADNSILVFKCLNQECGKPIKFHRPQKSGIYPVTCPHCKVQKKINIKGLDAYESNTLKKDTGKATSNGLPDNSSKEPIKLTHDFIIDQEYKIICPHCNEQEIKFNSHKSGHKEFPCPRCSGKIELDVRDKTQVNVEYESVPVISGKLVLLRRGWLNKDYKLGLGSHVIGRYDDEEVSDIAIKNDPTMSRRSIKIDVTQTSKGILYKLSVLKSTNPVLHNGSKLSVGESVSLDFGDTIVLGKTKFRFDIDR